MGSNSDVKKYTQRKIEYQNLAASLEHYVNILRDGFQRGESLPKKISTPSSERQLRKAVGDFSYENVIKLTENIEKLMYHNTPEWKRKITQYVEGWTFIQKQVLFNLRTMQDLITKITSAAVIGQQVLANNERNALQREVDQYADQIIELSTNTNGPNGLPLFHTPQRFGHYSSGDNGAQPFIGAEGQKIPIKGSIQFKINRGLNHPAMSGADHCEEDLLNFFVDATDNNNISRLRNDDGLAYFDSSNTGKARVHWADVRNEYYSTLTVFLCNGTMNASFNEEMCKVYPNDKYPDYPERNVINRFYNDNGDFFYDKYESFLNSSNVHSCTLSSGKNLAECLSTVIMTQEGYIDFNESALKMAIEQGKMTYEKAFEIQEEVVSILQNAETSLEQKYNLSALLAVSSATALVT